MRRRVLVVGGGLSGLLAAHRLQRGGDQVLLIESEPRVGGAIASAELDGLEINVGAEAYATSSGAVDELVAELGLADRIAAPREGLGSRVVSDAGVHRAPTGAVLGIPARPLAADVRTVLGTAGALRARLEPVLPARWGNRPGATVEHLVRRRLGRRVAERLVAPVVGGVHSADARTLEFATASGRLHEGLAEHGSLLATVRRLHGRSGRSAGTRVHTLTPTMAALVETLRTQILAAGGMIRTGVTAASLERGPAGAPEEEAPEADRPEAAWVVLTTDGEQLSADHLVLACPPDTAATLLAGAAPGGPEIAARIPQAPSAPVRLVALVLDAPALDAFPAGTGALVAPGTAGLRAKALTHATAKWPHLQERARAAFPSAASPHLVRLSYGRPGEELPEPGTVVAQALTDASRILGTDLGDQHLLSSRVIDWDHAMRQALPGHRAALSTLTEHLGAEPALELVGSWRAGTGIDAIVRAETTETSAPAARAATTPATEGPRP